jgi:hypothetical protein
VIEGSGRFADELRAAVRDGQFAKSAKELKSRLRA